MEEIDMAEFVNDYIIACEGAGMLSSEIDVDDVAIAWLDLNGLPVTKGAIGRTADELEYYL